MNQILATSRNENNKNESYEEEQTSYDTNREIDFSDSFSQIQTNTMNIKKIIVIFSIAICVLGLVLAGVYGYKTYKNKKGGGLGSKPEVSITQKENSAVISAKSEAGINKIIYYWDETDKNELPIGGKTNYEKIIELPNGENNLIVQVVDQNGETTETSKSFIVDKDEEKPTIEITQIEEEGVRKIKIIATDETEMQYITYRWNIEEETKIEVEEEGETTIEATLDIQRGENTLTVAAVDASNNTETVEKPIIVGNEPVIEIGKAGDKLIMKINHDMGFKKVEFAINGKIYTYDEKFSGYDSAQKTLEYTFTLKEGKTTVVIIATSMENTTATYKGETTYSAQ